MASIEDSFGGRAGDVVTRAVSPVALITGVTLAALMAGVGYVAGKAELPQLAPVAFAVIIAAFLARAAVDAYDARWSAGRSVPFGDFMPVALRYLVMQAVLMAPLVVVGWRPDLFVGALVAAGDSDHAPAAAAVFVLYFACVVVAPPLLLVVAVSAGTFGQIVQPAQWGRCFGGRGSDLFLIYVLYFGAMVAVLVLCVPILGLVMLTEPRALITAGTICALFACGTAILLLGQLCGEFARPLRPEEPRMKIIARPQPTAAGTVRVPAPASPAGRPSGQESATIPIRVPAAPDPTVPQAAPTVRSPAPPASPAPAAPRKLPLLDGPKRVEQLVRESGGNPAQALAQLESLRDQFAPNGSVLHALTIGYVRAGRRADALATAREAIPLCMKSGSIVLAAEIAVALRDALDDAGVAPEQAVAFAEALRSAKRVPHAAALYGTLLTIRPVNTRIVKGALQTADDILAAGDAKSSLSLYGRLLECASGTPLHEFVRERHAEALRKAGSA